jgi:hypothetical protein
MVGPLRQSRRIVSLSLRWRYPFLRRSQWSETNVNAGFANGRFRSRQHGQRTITTLRTPVSS